MKVYVVAKVDWEYNDEIWYQTEGQGVIPLKGYRSKEKAEIECSKLNQKANSDPYRKVTNYFEDEEDAEYATEYKVVELEMENK